MTEEQIPECKNYEPVERFLYLHQDPISRNVVRSYQEFVAEHPASKENIELDRILEMYIHNSDFFKFVQAEYYQDDLPYYLNYFDEMRRLRTKFQALLIR